MKRETSRGEWGRRFQRAQQISARLRMGILVFGLITVLAMGQSDSAAPVTGTALPVESPTDPASETLAALDPSLPLETRRYLVYLYARVNKPVIAERMALSILESNPRDKQTLLVLASMYLEQRSNRKLWNIVDQLLEYYPNDDQTLYFQSAAHFIGGEFRESNAVLKDLKEDQFLSRLFPYTTDLASAARKSGDWYKSMLAYQELLRHHTLGDELRLEVRTILEGIYREHQPQAGLQGTHILLNQGWISRGVVDVQRHLSDSITFSLRAAQDEYSLEASDQTRERRASRLEGQWGIQWVASERWSFGGHAGISESGPFGGAEAERSWSEIDRLKLSLDWQEHAVEGMNFEILDGRQNRLTLEGRRMLEYDWMAYHALGLKQITIDQEILANGYGGNWGIEKVLLRKTPELRLGYRGQWLSYSREATDLRLIDPVAPVGAPLPVREALLEGLVRTQNHRHGLYASFTTGRSGWYTFRGLVGGDYVLDMSSMEFYSDFGFVIYPRKSIELTANVAYSSSANTSDSASDQWLFNLMLRWYY